MEEAEIDEWFNEQKERLEERFYTEASKDVYKAKEHFDQEYKKLIKQLQQKHEALYDHKVKVAKLQKPFARLQERYALLMATIQQWITERKLAIKKWFFDRKIKRILRDHSDR